MKLFMLKKYVIIKQKYIKTSLSELLTKLRDIFN